MINVALHDEWGHYDEQKKNHGNEQHDKPLT